MNPLESALLDSRHSLTVLSQDEKGLLHTVPCHVLSFQKLRQQCYLSLQFTCRLVEVLPVILNKN